MTQVALYARVSTDMQAQTDTIASQIFALENRIVENGYTLLEPLKFIDNGYSGANLIRPRLENLRDKVASGEIDKVYVHSPDRLSRKYAHQMILMEEFQNASVSSHLDSFVGRPCPISAVEKAGQLLFAPAIPVKQSYAMLSR